MRLLSSWGGKKRKKERERDFTKSSWLERKTFFVKEGGARCHKTTA